MHTRCLIRRPDGVISGGAGKWRERIKGGSKEIEENGEQREHGKEKYISKNVGALFTRGQKKVRGYPTA